MGKQRVSPREWLHFTSDARIAHDVSCLEVLATPVSGPHHSRRTIHEARLETNVQSYIVKEERYKLSSIIRALLGCTNGSLLEITEPGCKPLNEKVPRTQVFASSLRVSFNISLSNSSSPEVTVVARMVSFLFDAPRSNCSAVMSEARSKLLFKSAASINIASRCRTLSKYINVNVFIRSKNTESIQAVCFGRPEHEEVFCHGFPSPNVQAHFHLSTNASTNPSCILSAAHHLIISMPDLLQPSV